MKNIVIGVTGSIAAYKAVDLVSQLSKDKDLNIEVIMTKSACEFVQPLSFEALLQKKIHVDTFGSRDGKIYHVGLASQADLMVMVPASANSIAKVVHGLADDMLSSTWLAATCPKLICPAMNVHMFENPATQDNIKKAKEYGMKIVDPATGHLACGVTAKGKLADVYDILDEIYYVLNEKPLLGKKVLVNAGPTKEALDPVRFITNHSTGKMGYAIAKQAAIMGAEVTLVSGPTNLKAPKYTNFVSVTSSQEMADAVLSKANEMDYIILSAAVADYRPKTIATQKIKKSDSDFSIELERTTDILKTLGETKHAKQMLCGFAMETENLIENAKAKLEKKNCDMIVANSLSTSGAGFGVDTNIATFITKDGNTALPLMSKDDLAKEILLKLKQMEEAK